MNRLLEIGFEPAGHWTSVGAQLDYTLSRHSTQRNILYAFVSDGVVKYVGKTTRSLAERMAGYKRPGRTQTTNINNHRRIRESLDAGAAVEILALPDNGLLHYGQFHLNLAAGLEDSLIKILDPEWNGGRLEPASAVASGDTAETDNAGFSPVQGSFPLVLQPTYYRTGFFNIGVTNQAAIGADGDTIEIFLGSSQRPVLGAINRRANTNGTPRIMGGTAVRDWFYSSCKELGRLQVDVLSPTAIRLTPVEPAQDNTSA